jgi:hypothetical protein
MLDFIEQETDLSFSRWRWFCVDHGERSGSFPEFVGRLARCRQALTRRSTHSQPLPRQENGPSKPTRSHAGNLEGV